MASTEPSKQINFRLPLSHLAKLKQLAEEQGKAPGTLAKEMVIAMLDGGGATLPNENSFGLDADLLLDKLDSIDERVGQLGDTYHIALRTLLKCVLVPLENQQAQQSLDMVLGPLPIPKRN